ncbi:protein CUP-SHAPED COTYLEDON 2-like [Musa acuminata AAA Group]|uniref:protein CUP-SHAPED COTYLEDON 2-like n=1 Tax=Musa acuminata AAA Group TaxID=214697 RepID=UPI0031E2AF36
MDPVDVVPSGYRFLPTAEELVVDYLANCIAGTPLPSRAVAFADVYGTEPWNLLCSDRQEGYFFAERKPKNSGGSRVDRKAGTGSWTLNKKQEPVKSLVDGREMVVGRKSFLSFNDGRRKNSGWVMYEYEMCSPGFERRVLCHVKKSSHHAISGGNFIKKVESTFTEAATETVSGGSLVGQKRNREESSALSAKASTLSKKPALSLQSDVSPPPTAVVQHPISARPVTPPESRLSSVDSVAPNEAGVPSAALSSTDVCGGEPLITVEELEAFLASPSPSVDLGDEQNCIDDAFFTREVEASLMSDDTDTASNTIPKASPSGLVDPRLMPDDTRIDSTTVVEVSTSSSSIDFVACEKMYFTDDPFFWSLEEVHAFLMSDDTFAASTTEQMACVDDARSTTPKALQPSLISDGTGTDSTTAEVVSSSSSYDFVGCEQTENVVDVDDFMQEIDALMKSDDTPVDSAMISWLEQ